MPRLTHCKAQVVCAGCTGGFFEIRGYLYWGPYYEGILLFPLSFVNPYTITYVFLQNPEFQLPNSSDGRNDFDLMGVQMEALKTGPLGCSSPPPKPQTFGSEKFKVLVSGLLGF